MYYGKGWTHSDVYNMPIYLRTFYFKRLQKHFKEQAAEYEKARSGASKPSFKK